MKTKPSFFEKLRYRFENTLSAGTIAIIGWLAVFSLLIVVVFGVVFLFTADYSDKGFAESAWQTFMRTIDPGTIAGDEGWIIRGISLLITIGGIFILSTLIGSLTSGLEAKLDDLRKGRSKVLENGHTLILGWSPKIFHIISELVIANENQSKPRIVILADMDKVEMEDEIRAKIEDKKNTKIICRTGSPIDLTDLQIVNPNAAKSIIILSPEEVDNPDIYVVKSVLALTNNPSRKEGKYHIVAEIKDVENMEAADLVGGDEAVYIQTNDLIARVTAQTCRQSGLSIIYTELLDFDGDEVYFEKAKPLAGKTFKETLFAYNDCSIMGLMHGNGEVKINPPMDLLIKEDDQVVAIAEDDDKVVISNVPNIKIVEEAIIDGHNEDPVIEKNLILGWNGKGPTIVSELDNYVLKGSALYVVADKASVENELDEVKSLVTNQTIHFVEGDITKRTVLDNLDIASYNNIILLAYPDLPVQESDAKTLIALLHLRNIIEKANMNISIVSEMGDIKNRELAEVTKADDYIISANLVSLMLSQLSENKHLKKVFDDLFDADGSEVYLKPITQYIKPGIEVDFYTLLESAARKGQVAIGYRQLKYQFDHDKAFGVVVNPVKSDKITFAENDKIIVLAED